MKESARQWLDSALMDLRSIEKIMDDACLWNHSKHLIDGVRELSQDHKLKRDRNGSILAPHPSLDLPKPGGRRRKPSQAW